MAFADEVEGSEVRVGDTICVIGNGATIFHNLVVTDVFEDRIRASHVDSVGLQSRTDTFTLLDSYWKFYLVERPKQPLPTKLGSVVKASGVEWVLCDPGNAEPWYSPKANSWLANEDLAGIDWEEVV